MGFCERPAGRIIMELDDVRAEKDDDARAVRMRRNN